MLLRDRAHGGRSAVTSSHLLWVEVDAPDAHKRLLSAPAAPTAVVSSGTPGHLHAYWLLADAVSADQVAELNRKLAGTVGGDLASRRPGTHPQTPVHAESQTRPGDRHRPRAARPLARLRRARAHRGAASTRVRSPSTHRQQCRGAAGRDARRGGGRSTTQLRQIPSANTCQRLSGQELTAEGKIRCPFHADGQERTPSLQVYPPFEWACFGCQRGGTIYDFASHLWAIPTKGPQFRELRDRLADVFGLQVQDEPHRSVTTPGGAGITR